MEKSTTTHTRNRWQQLYKIIDGFSDQEFEDFIFLALSPPSPDATRTWIDDVEITFPVDLRTMTQTMKINAANPALEWSAYINNAGTLAHIIHLPSETLLRYEFLFPVKRLSPRRQHAVLKEVTNKFKL